METLMGILSRFNGRAQLPPESEWDTPTFLRRPLEPNEWARPSMVGRPRERMRATMTPPDRPGFWMMRTPGDHPWTVVEVIAGPRGELWFGWGTEPAHLVEGSGREWSSRPTQEVPT